MEQDDKVEIRTWDAHYGIGNDPKKFWYYKAKVIRKRAQDPVNMSGLVSHIRTRKPIKDKVWTPGDRTFLVGNSDWQLGKRDKDNGLLFVVAVEDRRLHIFTGYGLEGILPDGEVVGSIQGARPKREFAKLIDEII